VRVACAAADCQTASAAPPPTAWLMVAARSAPRDDAQRQLEPSAEARLAVVR
jgi:hypothetical protein